LCLQTAHRRDFVLLEEKDTFAKAILLADANLRFPDDFMFQITK